METSSESTEEPTQKDQKSSRRFFIAAGKFAEFEFHEPILDDGQ
jgi:hypothetical protein